MDYNTILSCIEKNYLTLLTLLLSLLQAHNTTTEPRTEHSSSRVTTVPEPAIANHSDLSRSSKSGPIGFESTEDLLHRLFLTISGIADQLQSNYPRDFRAILKQAFAICQSDDDEMMFDDMRSNEESERETSSNVFASQSKLTIMTTMILLNNITYSIVNCFLLFFTGLYDLSLTGIATSNEGQLIHQNTVIQLYYNRAVMFSCFFETTTIPLY